MSHSTLNYVRLLTGRNLLENLELRYRGVHLRTFDWMSLGISILNTARNRGGGVLDTGAVTRSRGKSGLSRYRLIPSRSWRITEKIGIKALLVSMVICTRNRASSLARTLASAAAMDVPAGLRWELLLVDNGSTDHTADIALKFADRLPIRRVIEPNPGLSNARNCAVREAAGDYICWTDDDVVIDRSWLKAYVEAFQINPEAAFFGGPIEPELEGKTPQWFVDNLDLLGTLLAERSFGDHVTHLNKQDGLLPFGANFAVRSREQHRHLYDPNLGVAPQQRRLGEETATMLRIMREGGGGVCVSGARVQHIIPENRQSLNYVARYQQSVGETWAYLSETGEENFMGTSTPGRSVFLGLPVGLLARALAHRTLFAVCRRTRPSVIWLGQWQKYNYYLGALRQCYRS